MISGFIFLWILATSRGRPAATPVPYTFSTPLHAGPVPKALNGFALWIGLMVALTVVNYGLPIVQFAAIEETSVPVIRVGGPR